MIRKVIVAVAMLLQVNIETFHLHFAFKLS